MAERIKYKVVGSYASFFGDTADLQFPMNRGSRLDDWFPNNLYWTTFKWFKMLWERGTWQTKGLRVCCGSSVCVPPCCAVGAQSQELAVSASATGSLHSTGWFPTMLFMLNLINTVVSCMDCLCWWERKEFMCDFEIQKQEKIMCSVF